jgi:hypothetical protein
LQQQAGFSPTYLSLCIYFFISMDFLDSVATTLGQQQKQTIAEKQLRPLLLDESVQVLSTFELNQIASLTFNDVLCDDIFEVIEKICSKPLEYTPISIQKALVVTKHIVIYGQDKCVNYGYGLIDYFKSLTNFNTVLMTQQQGGALAFFQSIQGGGVDKGGPVRDSSQQLVNLLSNIPELQRLRQAKASQESLVPIGDDKVAFVTDEVRHDILKKRIEAERQIQIKSNLAKADNGFGAGYGSRDGKSVVGAAHGIEEMIKMANLQKKKFTDEQDHTKPPGYKSEEEIILEELRAEAAAAREATAHQHQQHEDVDLLGFDTNKVMSPNGQQDVDLLGFGDAISTNNSGTGDLLGSGGAGGLGGGLTTIMPTPSPALVASDPFGLSSLSLPTNNSSAVMANNNTPSDPFASVVGGANAAPFISSMTTTVTTTVDNTYNNDHNSSGLASLSLGMASMGLGGVGGTSGMTPSADRFAALDALAANVTSNNNLRLATATTFDAKIVEDRILGGLEPNRNASSFLTNTSLTSPSPSSYNYVPGMVTPGGGLHVAKAYGDPSNDNGDNPWVMGGTAGTGLQPVGPAPGAPPPPPPPPTQTF